MDLDDKPARRFGGCGELARTLGEHHRALASQVGDLTKLLDELAPKILGYETVALDSAGQATRSYRVPFRCIYVESQSTHLLTVANSPGETETPNLGPGIGFVKIGGASVLNFRSYSWSVFGGAPGELVTVTVFSQPQPPFSR